MVKKTRDKTKEVLPEDTQDTIELSLSGEVLIEKLKEAEKKADETYERYLRVLADFDNYKKRAAKEKAELTKFCNENIIKDIVPLIDNLDRAIVQACKAGDFEAFRNGLQLARDQVLSCLKKHGIEEIESAGRDFDPNLHEALCHLESKEHARNRIIDEFEKGYLLHGRLLKPSRVSVSKGQKKNILADNKRPDYKEE